jgi:hypothetical protein
MNTLRCVIVALGTIVGSVQSVFANEVTTSVEVSRASVQIAEPFDVVIKVRAAAGTRVAFPPVPPQLGDFDVIEHTDSFDVPDPQNSGSRTWLRRLKLESLLTGELTIPSLTIHTISATDKQVVVTDEARIEVVSVLEVGSDPLKFRDIRSEVDVEVAPPVSYRWLGWVMACGGGLAAIGLFVATVMRRRQWVSAKQWALAELESCGHSNGMRAADAALVYSRIELVVRTYLESEFEFPATRQTTAELRLAMDSFMFPPTVLARFGQLFAAAEQARYAGCTAQSSELAEAVEVAEALISELDSMDMVALLATPRLEKH